MLQGHQQEQEMQQKNSIKLNLPRFIVHWGKRGWREEGALISYKDKDYHNKERDLST